MPDINTQLGFDLGDTPIANPALRRAGEKGVGSSGKSARTMADNLYFAWLPDAAEAAEIERVAQREGLAVGFRGRTQLGRFHISLTYVGGFDGLPAEPVTASEKAGATVALPPFRATFDRIASFGRPDNAAVVLRCGQGAIEFTRLERQMREALTAHGWPVKAISKFEPHLTLFYHRGGVAEGFLEQPISFDVRGFALVHSPYGQVRHNVPPHWRWPLNG